MVDTLIGILISMLVLGPNQLLLNHMYKRRWYSIKVWEYLITGSVIFGSLGLLGFVIVGTLLLRALAEVLPRIFGPIVVFLEWYIVGGPLDTGKNSA